MSKHLLRIGGFNATAQARQSEPKKALAFQGVAVATPGGQDVLERSCVEMQTVGFDSFEVSTRKPQDGERPFDHGTILARRGSSETVND
jgi:hypothetical protein